ncbi:MAG TPA: hypothetical protein VMT94_05465 [Burkholderiales bacterium]|nr:hypothetical protein [Burkholderiales bacterium]
MDPAKDRVQPEVNWVDYFDALIDERFKRFINARRAAAGKPATDEDNKRKPAPEISSAGFESPGPG